MNRHLLRLGPRTQVALMVFAPCVLLSSYIMSPLWSAQFHPVDDHEFAAMLSLKEGSFTTRLFVRFFEMSPAQDFPYSTHWRPAVWIVRALEAEFLGTHVHLYFFLRTLLLAILGLLAAAFALAIKEALSHHTSTSLFGILPAASLGLFVISTPVLFDVFGRLLPGEMYALIGLVSWLVAWAGFISRRRQSLAPSAMQLSLFLTGLVLIATGKEDASFLWPIAVALSFPEILYLRHRGAFTFLLSIASTGVLWLAGSFQTFNAVFLSGAGLPYHMSDEPGFKQVMSVVPRINLVHLTFSLCAIALIAVGRRKISSDIFRIVFFLVLSLFFELVYVSSVPVSVPRYSAVILVLASLLIFCGVSVLSTTVRPSTVLRRIVTALTLAGLFALAAIGVGHQRSNNVLYRDISLSWNSTLSEIFLLTQEGQFEQLLLVVDPPDSNSLGRWEKSYSFAKSMRLRTDAEVRQFMVVMDSKARGVLPNVESALRATSLFGRQDAAGQIFHPRSLIQDLETLCVLYSSSGRSFPYLDTCASVYRLTL